MLKIFRFECPICNHEFEEMVEGIDGQPEKCMVCGNEENFIKLPTVTNIPPPIDWNK